LPARRGAGAREEAAKPDRELRRLLDGLNEGAYVTDGGRRILFWNRAAERISGYRRGEVQGRRCADNILVHVDGRGRSLCRGVCPLGATLRDGRARRGEIFLRHKDGHRVPVRVRTLPRRDRSGNVVQAIELFEDLTEKQDLGARLEELRKLAMVDRLTGAANRYFTEKSLEAQLEDRGRRSPPLGIIFFDIDDFKRINDRFSHRVGDRALRTVARTLQSNVRAADLVGRWGGEEFLVIVGQADRRILRRIAEKLRLLVGRSVFWEKERPLRVTLSGGATLARKADTVRTLVERADLLMYRSKRSGKNRVSYS
jgi:diguanylate cyclase (GGDEF)-like protein/PAS domain S-box-containing protein